MKKIAIFGTSGFALEVADICIDIGYKSIVLLSNEKEENKRSNNLLICNESKAENFHTDGYEFAIGIGDSNIRKKIYNRYKHFTFPNLIHSSALFGYQQRLAFEHVIGNIITAGVIFTNSISVGNFGVYNLNCSIGHECVIDDFVSIMPSATISGNVHLSKAAFIGASATILQGNIENKLVVGQNAIVGACSLVNKNIEANVTVVGSPARNIK
jgi:sugar O-acyltransferase (sialic acid O-acetyltransferase NeuD family)